MVNAVAVANSEADGWQALVIARPSKLEESSYTVLDLPEGLNGEVGRMK